MAEMVMVMCQRALHMRIDILRAACQIVNFDMRAQIIGRWARRLAAPKEANQFSPVWATQRPKLRPERAGSNQLGEPLVPKRFEFLHRAVDIFLVFLHGTLYFVLNLFILQTELFGSFVNFPLHAV